MTSDNSLRFRHLNEKDLHSDPFSEFKKWYQNAHNYITLHPEAAVLSTIDADQFPCSRNVLLRGFLPPYFQFFTNYNSNKAKELKRHPKACLLFYWKKLGQQIRIWGTVEKSSDIENDNYWYTRPESHRIHAWASDQSSEIKDYESLAKAVEAIKLKFKDKKITRPDHWGGFNLKAQKFEFWQEGESRLHHRFLYVQKGEQWIVKRLCP